MKEKKCSKCGNVKPVNNFGEQKSKNGSLNSHCKQCSRIRSSAYKKTKNGLITTIYSGQKACSIRRNHPAPTYTKQELKDWCFSQELFHELYNDWASSGYSRWLTPSCDRTDDYEGYSLDRLQLMPWIENMNKGHYDMKNGINNKNNKSVVGINKITGKKTEFHSQKEAGRITGTADSSISICCRGKLKSAGGYIWKRKL